MDSQSASNAARPTSRATIHEFREGTLAEVSLTQADIQYLREEWPAITVTATSDTSIVESSNTVGVIGLPSGDGLYITPKVDANLLYLLAYTDRVSERVVRDREPAAFEAGQSLPELLGKLLQSELNYILRQGLDSAYEVQTGTERYVRGQIQVDKQLQRHGPMPIKFECRYQSLTYDIPINQVVLSATDTLIRLLPPSGIRSELIQSRTRLSNYVTLPAEPHEAVESVSLTRLNDHYESALLLAELILQEQLLQGFDTSTHPFPSMIFNMPSIFEDTVVRAIRAAIDQARYTVTTNDLGVFATSVDKSEQRRLEPDFVIRQRTDGQGSNPVVAVGDAKWKQTKSASTGDFYQLATYQSYANTPGLLLYPEGEIEPRVYEYMQSTTADATTLETNSTDTRGNLQVESIKTATTAESYQRYITRLEKSVMDAVAEVTTADE